MWKKKRSTRTEPPQRLAPLEEIRQEEAKIAQRILLAREQAEATQQDAQRQVEMLKQQAYQRGIHDGEAAATQKIAEAQREAEHIVAQARAQALVIAAQVESSIEPATVMAEHIVLGWEGEGQIQ